MDGVPFECEGYFQRQLLCSIWESRSFHGKGYLTRNEVLDLEYFWLADSYVTF